MESESEANAASAARSVNAFAFDLYEKIACEEENVFFSPYSIHQAMHMAFDGAGGTTAEQMSKSLRLQGAEHRLALEENDYCRRYPHEVKLANAMWGQSGYAFHEWYMKRLKSKHHANFGELDFADQTASARLISEWIENNTGGRIRNMISAASHEPLMRLILTNAIYLRADWREKFDPQDTKLAPFHVNRNEKVNVMMMHQLAHFRAVQGLTFDAIALAYEGFGLCMYVLM